MSSILLRPKRYNRRFFLCFIAPGGLRARLCPISGFPKRSMALPADVRRANPMHHLYLHPREALPAYQKMDHLFAFLRIVENLHFGHAPSQLFIQFKRGQQGLPSLEHFGICASRFLTSHAAHVSLLHPFQLILPALSHFLDSRMLSVGPLPWSERDRASRPRLGR